MFRPVLALPENNDCDYIFELLLAILLPIDSDSG